MRVMSLLPNRRPWPTPAHASLSSLIKDNQLLRRIVSYDRTSLQHYIAPEFPQRLCEQGIVYSRHGKAT